MKSAVYVKNKTNSLIFTSSFKTSHFCMEMENWVYLQKKH